MIELDSDQEEEEVPDVKKGFMVASQVRPEQFNKTDNAVRTCFVVLHQPCMTMFPVVLTEEESRAGGLGRVDPHQLPSFDGEGRSARRHLAEVDIHWQAGDY